MKKIIYYIFISSLVFIILLIIIYVNLNNFQNSVEATATIIQTLAIMVGGLWAYHKFGWEKKCENIISLKAALMKFSHEHNLSASKFHEHKDIGQYKINLLNSYSQLSHKIHLSYYVPKKLRNKIFDTIWLTVGNDSGKDNKDLIDNWNKYEVDIKEIYNEFDKIIDT